MVAVRIIIIAIVSSNIFAPILSIGRSLAVWRFGVIFGLGFQRAVLVQDELVGIFFWG